ncbi:MAG: MEDS domain-containing protein [Acidobacteriota bacterium]|nr:MEDS domain-containing protein [Acidobacteriota bacterium]
MLRSIKFDSAVELGIKEQYLAPGDHVAYFWETDDEFRAAVGFLAVGIREGDYCVIFGYDEANNRVLEELLCREFDCDRLKLDGRLSILTGASSGEEMLARIGADFTKAIEGGARMIRLLGNIGWGREKWPDDKDILEFEARVTGAVANLPAVVVCMYDVQSIRGDILLQGAFETHPLTIRRNILRENEHYVPLEEFLKQLKLQKV